MSKTVQFLVAAACIVVMAAGSFWLYDRNQMRLAASADAELREQIRDAQRVSDCRAAVRDWYSPGALQLAGTEGDLSACVKTLAKTVEEAEDCAALIVAWGKSNSAPPSRRATA